MSHVSKHKLEGKIKQKLENHLINFLVETSGKTRRRVFRELCTPTERLMFGKRLAIVYMIEKEVPDRSIARLLKISTSTVGRFGRKIDKSNFIHTGAWLNRHSRQNKVLDFLVTLASIPFRAQHTSLGRLLDELS